MGPPYSWSRRWGCIRRTPGLLRLEEAIDYSFVPKAFWHGDPHWLSGCTWMVHGEVRPRNFFVRHPRCRPAGFSISTRGTPRNRAGVVYGNAGHRIGYHQGPQISQHGYVEWSQVARYAKSPSDKIHALFVGSHRPYFLDRPFW